MANTNEKNVCLWFLDVLDVCFAYVPNSPEITLLLFFEDYRVKWTKLYFAGCLSMTFYKLFNEIPLLKCLMK